MVDGVEDKYFLIKEILLPSQCYWKDEIDVEIIVENKFTDKQVEVSCEITGDGFNPREDKVWGFVKKKYLKRGINKLRFKYKIPQNDWGPRDLIFNINSDIYKKERFLILPGLILEAVDGGKTFFTASEPVDINCILSNESKFTQYGRLTLIATDDIGNKNILVEKADVCLESGRSSFYHHKILRRKNLRYIDVFLKDSNDATVMAERLLLQKKISPHITNMPRAALSIRDTKQALDEFDSFTDYCPYLIEATKDCGPWRREALAIAKSRGLMVGLGHFLANNLGYSWRLHTEDALGRNAYDVPDSIGTHHGSSKALWALQGFIRGGRDALHDYNQQHFKDIYSDDFEDTNEALLRTGQGEFGLYKDHTWFKGHDAAYQIEYSYFFGVADNFGPYAPIAGYKAEEVLSYRRALKRQDSGFRMLEDQRNYKRIKFPELFELVYDRKFLTPGELGFTTWDEYEPIKITVEQIHGDIKTEEELQRVRTHLLLLAYFQAKSLDMWSQYTYNHVLDCQITLNWDFVVNGHISYLIYRLPYVQTISRELFLSNYDHCLTTNYTDGAYWRAICEKYGKRIRLLQEAGDGGSGPTYFTPYSTLAGSYAEVAAVKFHDFQVDWHKTGAIDANLWESLKLEKGMLLNSTLEKKEMSWEALHNLSELAQLKGFADAWSDGAQRIHDIPSMLLLTSDRIRYPSTYRGYNRWGDMHLDMGYPQQGFVEWNRILRENGYLYDTYRTSIFDASYLNRYRTIIFNAVRYSSGTIEQLHDWLMLPPDGSIRTLVVNNILPLQADLRSDIKWNKNNPNTWYRHGRLEWPLDANVKWRRKASDVWKKFGIETDEPEKVMVKSLTISKNSPLSDLGIERELLSELPAYIVKAPNNAEVWLENQDNKPLIWSVSVGYSGLNRLIYSALPFEILPKQATGDIEFFKKVATGIASKALNYYPGYSFTDETAFVGLYNKSRKKGWKVIVIRESERVIPKRPHLRPVIPPQNLWDWVKELAPEQKETLLIYGLPADKKFVLVESESSNIVATGRSTKDGTLKLNFKVGMAGYYDLAVIEK